MAACAGHAHAHQQPVERVRVRFENPTNPKLREMWDLTLQDRDAEVSLERWGFYPQNEPFYKDPTDRRRVAMAGALPTSFRAP